MGPGDLEDILEGIRFSVDRKLLVGIETRDDAAVYLLDKERAIVESVDFFTPVVDDPEAYGRIAVANALSDIYAMGATPLLALNILCFSEDVVPKSVVRKILRGGLEKASEAGISIAGGHSVEDKELKYGLCVLGIAQRSKIVRNSGAKVGDVIILTKPLGIGLMTTGIKFGLLNRKGITRAVSIMETLNKDSSRAMVDLGVNACTDVTGFGLLGHGFEMAKASNVEIEIWYDSVPVLPEAFDMLKKGAIPGGLCANRRFLENRIIKSNVKDSAIDLLCDPQTSGGLLVSIEPSKADRYLEMLRKKGNKWVNRIGKVLAKGRGRIIVK
ncbi:MAG: selenide, water dikinase SelD [bacterium]